MRGVCWVAFIRFLVHRGLRGIAVQAVRVRSGAVVGVQGAASALDKEEIFVLREGLIEVNLAAWLLTY